MARLATVDLDFIAPTRVPDVESSLLERHGSDAHAFRTSWLAEKLGVILNLGDGDISDLVLAARFHDIGKSALHPKLLEQALPLSGRQIARIQTHPELGARMLREMRVQLGPALTGCIQGALFHHERWDGYGYPSRLKGREIPRIARAIAVVDVFDALLSVRPYKEAWEFDRAIAYITENAGSHFDPALVEAFLVLVMNLPQDWIGEAVDVQKKRIAAEHFAGQI